MSMANTTFIAEAAGILATGMPLPKGLEVRATSEHDADLLAHLWLAAYASQFATDLDEAQQEMKGMFAGEYGPLWAEASPLLFSGARLLAGICTVVKAPWERTPTCPFIVDLMVHPDYRRQGLAAYLMQETARVVLRTGHTHVALRVMVDNWPAIKLYRKLGFVDWDGKLFAPGGQK